NFEPCGGMTSARMDPSSGRITVGDVGVHSDHTRNQRMLAYVSTRYPLYLKAHVNFNVRRQMRLGLRSASLDRADALDGDRDRGIAGGAGLVLGERAVRGAEPQGQGE